MLELSGFVVVELLLEQDVAVVVVVLVVVLMDSTRGIGAHGIIKVVWFA